MGGRLREKPIYLIIRDVLAKMGELATLAIFHVDHNNIYVWMLFTDYSSTFNLIIPSRLIMKFGNLHIRISPYVAES